MAVDMCREKMKKKKKRWEEKEKELILDIPDENCLTNHLTVSSKIWIQFSFNHKS
jgi:hypothetical protein